MKRAIFAALAVISGLARPSAGETPPATRFTLDNGLRVILHPVPQAKRVACTVVYTIGEESDPPGKSGMAHFVEHLLVTAAAGERPVRTADAWMTQRKRQCNAQTMRSATLIADVIAPNELEARLREIADEWTDLRITDADVERERPRIQAELSNMYNVVGQLAAMNRARALVDPMAEGAQKGGVPDQIETITVDELRAFHGAYYGPGNMIVTVVGRFDPDTTRAQIQTLLASLSPGDVPPGPRAAAPARDGVLVTVPLKTSPVPSAAALAVRVPDFDDDAFPAFLVVATRLMSSARASGIQAAWTPLDDPRGLFLYPTRQVVSGAAELHAALAAAQQEPPGEADRQRVRMYFGRFLGMVPLSAQEAAKNPYFAALVLARGEQMSLDGEAISAALEALDAASFNAGCAAWLAPERTSVVVTCAQ